MNLQLAKSILVIVPLLLTGTSELAPAQTDNAPPDERRPKIEAIIIRGNRQIPSSTIRKSISNHVGDIYDPAKVAHDVAAIKATGYFDDVRAETADSPAGGKVVTFYVGEKNESLPPGTPYSPSTPLPDEIGEQYNRASRLLWAGELKEAQTAFEAVLQRKPDYANARVLLGLTLRRLSEQSENLGETTLAVAQLRQALVHDPDEAYWHRALAKLLHTQGNAEEAAQECAQAAKLSPDDADLTRGCGFGARPEIAKDDAIPKGTQLAATPDSTLPIPVQHAAPPYSEKARAAKLQGTLVLWAVVGVQGNVEQAAVEHALGLGLDESSLRTVRTWRFKPATIEGIPMRVRVMVEMSFSLF